MPSDDERIKRLERELRIAELEEELSELRGGERRPLTRAEIRKMTPEQAKAEWDRITASLPDEREEEVEPMVDEEEPAKAPPARKGPLPVGVDRLRDAYTTADEEARR